MVFNQCGGSRRNSEGFIITACVFEECESKHVGFPPRAERHV